MSRTINLIIAGILLCLGDGFASAAHSGFVETDGTRFVLNGRTFRFCGTNNYYQMIHRRGDDAPGADEVLQEMAARGMTVLRTWAFQDQVEHPSGTCLQCAPQRQLSHPSEAPTDWINEDTLVGLDELLATADSLGIRLILTFVNNWDDYGGMNRYTLWRFGSTDHDQFYIDTGIRGWFQDYITVIVNRINSVNGRIYRDDPTIFAWELANEPQVAGGVSAAHFDAWVAEMSAYIKSIDSNHLVTTGITGYYGPANASRNTHSWMQSTGTDFIDNHVHASIDFATFHVWPQHWGWDPIGNTAYARTQATRYVTNHLVDARDIIGKPVIIEEFGIPRDNYGLGPLSGPTAIRDGFYADVYYSLCEQPAVGVACGGTLNWIVYDDETSAYDDGNGVYFPTDSATEALISAHALFMNESCYVDGDCDDGAFCNGVERCIANVCQAGINPCDDDLVCTDDLCDEGTDHCDHDMQPDEYGPEVAVLQACRLTAQDTDGTVSLQACAQDPSANRGWVVLHTGGDGADILSSEYGITGQRPKLTVEFPVDCRTNHGCDGLNPCTDNACVDSACVNPPGGADIPCSDGLYCNAEETCQGGVCVASTASCPDSCEQCDEGTGTCYWCIYDLDFNGWIASGDFGPFAGCYGQCYPPGDPCLAANFDASLDGCVGSGDFGGFAGCYGMACPECDICSGP
jgi:mannan endo-1,4-beta-mannosidase